MQNNIVKSLLIGIIAGVLIGLTGEYWDFEFNHYQPLDSGDNRQPELIRLFGQYGTTQAVIGGVIISLISFLIINKNKK